jgi:hypothetical protein
MDFPGSGMRYARMSTAPPMPGRPGDRGGSGNASNNKALSVFIRSWVFLSISRAWDDSAPSVPPLGAMASMELSIGDGAASSQVGQAGSGKPGKSG